MVIIKTAEEIELLRESALLVSRTLALIAQHIGPGVMPKKLDTMAYEFIKDHNAVPAFLGFNGFPASLCISVNEAVVHGIPGDKAFEEGDIVSVDCGVIKNQYVGDHAYTFAIGDISMAAKQLLRVTKESLYYGIAETKAGNRVGDIGFAIQNHVEYFGYGVVRELVGHGLGKSMHEEPQVPNYGKRGRGKKLENGMVIAIEPMVNMGTKDIRLLDDDWTIVTADEKYSAHFEHDVAIVNGLPEILSTFDWLETELEKRGMDAMRMSLNTFAAKA